MCRKGVVKTRHREVRSAEKVVDSEGRTGRSGDRVVDSESQICRQNVIVTPRAEQAEVPTSMACLVLVKKKKERKRERESEREKKRDSPFLWCHSELSGRARVALFLGVTPSYRAGVGLSHLAGHPFAFIMKIMWVVLIIFWFRIDIYIYIYMATGAPEIHSCLT